MIGKGRQKLHRRPSLREYGPPRRCKKPHATALTLRAAAESCRCGDHVLLPDPFKEESWLPALAVNTTKGAGSVP